MVFFHLMGSLMLSHATDSSHTQSTTGGSSGSDSTHSDPHRQDPLGRLFRMLLFLYVVRALLQSPIDHQIDSEGVVHYRPIQSPGAARGGRREMLL